MSFDSDCRSGASPGANPLRGQKRHEIVDIWHLTRVSYHSSSSPSPFILVIVIAIIIVVIIIAIIIFVVYYLLVSSLLLSFVPRCRLVFLSMCECRIIFWSKTSSSISPFRDYNNSSNFAVFCCSSGCATRLAKSKQALSHSATLPEWLPQPLSHSATLAERLTQPLSHSEWLSGWVAGRVALSRAGEWLSVCPSHSGRAAEFYLKIFFGNKEYINLVCMIVMWSNKAIVASRVLFYLYILFEEIFNIFHSKFVVFLSCILQSSVFGTNPCFIEIYVSYDILLTHINIIKTIILTN